MADEKQFKKIPLTPSAKSHTKRVKPNCVNGGASSTLSIHKEDLK